MRRFFLAALMVTLAACDESLAGPTAPIDQEFVLAAGESSVVETISVRFVRVANDSRCPEDVVCVWSGDAQVQITVTSTNQSKEYDLHTRDRKPVTHEGYTIA